MCEKCGAVEFADWLEKELEAADFGNHGNAFLAGVLEWVKDNGHVTLRQRTGVDKWIEGRDRRR